MNVQADTAFAGVTIVTSLPSYREFLLIQPESKSLFCIAAFRIAAGRG
jgi:hypothetical protein